MWNCERTSQDGVQLIEDVQIDFELGSQADRMGPEPCSLVRLRNKAGELLGTLSMQGWLENQIDFTEYGFRVDGPLVETAPNGYITKYHYDHGREIWNFTVVK